MSSRRSPSWLTRLAGRGPVVPRERYRDSLSTAEGGTATTARGVCAALSEREAETGRVIGAAPQPPSWRRRRGPLRGHLWTSLRSVSSPGSLRSRGPCRASDRPPRRQGRFAPLRGPFGPLDLGAPARPLAALLRASADA